MKILFKRKNRVLFTIIVIAVIVALLLIFADVFGVKSPLDGSLKLVRASKGLSQYEIKADFDPDNKTITCYQRTLYKNKTDDFLTHLYFHLYPNAFQYEDKAVFEKSDMFRAYPNGFSPGSLELYSVRINGDEADYVLGGYSEDILMLLLRGEMAPGDELSIEMEYTVNLPNSMGRFGYGENMYKVVNWYPIACVYDENVSELFWECTDRILNIIELDYEGKIEIAKCLGEQMPSLDIRSFLDSIGNDIHALSEKY
jgi:hypothetical protein